MKTGTIVDIQGTTVVIDGIPYDGSNVANFIPSVGSRVQYDADDALKLTFIRAGASSTYKKSFATTYRKPFTPKNTSKPFTPKQNVPFKKNDQSIIKQVIFKAAVEMHKIHPEVTLDEWYQQLKETYQAELS